MIVDLNETLYVVDEVIQEHKIIGIDLRAKTVTCEDGQVFEYAYSPLTVVIGNPDHSAIISKPKPDTSGLEALIQQAQDTLTSASPSTDGNDILPENKWVPQSVYDDLNNAIQTAGVLKTQGEEADYQMVEDSKMELQSKIEAFNNAKKDGTKKEVINSLEIKDVPKDSANQGVFTIQKTTTYTLSICGEGCISSGGSGGGSGAAWKGTVQLPPGTYNYIVYGVRTLAMDTLFKDANGTFKISAPGGGTSIYSGAVQITDNSNWIKSVILNKPAISGTPVSQLENGYGKGSEISSYDEQATGGYLSLVPIGDT